MLPAESENDALTDGRTDEQTDRLVRTETRTQLFKWRVLHNTTHFLKWRGIIKWNDTYCNMAAFILPAETPLTPGAVSKGQNISFLKVVMLHIKLMGA